MEIIESSTVLLRPIKTGYLNTLSGPTFLSRDKWKKRYFVLTATHLYRFKKLDDAVAGKTSETRVSLGEYDICQKDDSGVYKKDFVFILDGEIGKSQPRLVFAAPNNAEMHHWITELRRVLIRIQQSKVHESTQLSKSTEDQSGSTSLADFDFDENVDAFETNGNQEMDDSSMDSVLTKKNRKVNFKGLNNNRAFNYNTSDDSLEVWNDKGTANGNNSEDVQVEQKDGQTTVDLEKDVKEIKLDIELPSQKATDDGVDPSRKIGKISGYLKKKLTKPSSRFPRMKEMGINLKKKLLEFPDDYTLALTVMNQAKIAMAVIFVLIVIFGYLFFTFLINGMPNTAGNY